MTLADIFGSNPGTVSIDPEWNSCSTLSFTENVLSANGSSHHVKESCSVEHSAFEGVSFSSDAWIGKGRRRTDFTHLADVDLL